MSDVDISREGCQSCAAFSSTLDMATREQAAETGKWAAEVILALRAALDRAEADRVAAVEAAWAQGRYDAATAAFGAKPLSIGQLNAIGSLVFRARGDRT